MPRGQVLAVSLCILLGSHFLQPTCRAMDCTVSERTAQFAAEGIVAPDLSNFATNSEHGMMVGDHYVARFELSADNCERNGDDEYTGEAFIEFQSDALTFNSIQPFRMRTLDIREQLSAFGTTIFIHDRFAALGIGLAENRDLLKVLTDVNIDPSQLQPGTPAINAVNENRVIVDPAGDADFRFILEVIESATTFSEEPTESQHKTSFREEMQLLLLNSERPTNTPNVVSRVESEAELFWTDARGFTNVRMENTEIDAVPESNAATLSLVGIALLLTYSRKRRRKSHSFSRS